MNAKKVLALGVLSMMVMSGCLEAVDEEFVLSKLPEDWTVKTERIIATPQLVEYDSCDLMERDLKASIAEEYRTQLLQAIEETYNYRSWGDDMVAEAVMDDSDGGNSAETSTKRVEGEDFSGTNNQEQGVDEADFIKTDGYYIYVLQGSALSILTVPEFGEIEFTSNVSIEGQPISMMLDGERLIVLSSYSPWNTDQDDDLYKLLQWDDGYNSWRSSSMTKFTTYDISDRSEPEVVQELYLEGYNVDAREIGGSIRAVTHSWLYVPGLTGWLDLPSEYWDLDYQDEENRRAFREIIAYETILENAEALNLLNLEDLIPKIYERKDGTIIEHDMRSEDCQNFAKPLDGFSRGFTNILSLDLFSDSFSFESDHILSNHPLVYASQDVLVLSENSWDWWWFWGQDEIMEQTNIHTFDISVLGTTTYTGSGRIDGTILDQFSISEHEGVLRIATTVGQWNRWWMDDPTPMSSSIITLVRGVDLTTDQPILQEYGRLDGIAETERIWSARFVEDRAYLVTFRNIDPLWTIDLSNPMNPTILGELKVPGVSTYIHPINEDMLLTIGMGPAGEDGLGLDWSNTRLSTFDISNITDPQAASVLSLSPVENPDEGSWTWAYSEAMYEHKAFQYWGPKEMLAVPLSTYRWVDDSTNGEYSWYYEYVSKAILVKVNESTGDMLIHGEINHSSLVNSEESMYWWGGEQNIRRTIFMGDFIYAISGAGITVHNLDSMERTDVVAFDIEMPDYYAVY